MRLKPLAQRSIAVRLAVSALFWSTLILLVASIILIIPTSLIWNVAALALIAVVYFWQKAGSRNEPPGVVATA